MSMTMPMVGNPQKDAELIAASRGGDREAFGQIVRRYQGMICGLIYATCGDLHRSEDLAQDTFLSAWKSLSGLREPAKLSAWLCQIARHRAQDSLKKTSTERLGIGRFWSRMRESAPPPDQTLIQKEEEAVLWRALARIPQPYRDTLVLYYRQEKSTEQVAMAMETSEESIRQRLARGREMVRGEVASLMERHLESSAPGSSFAIAVLGALPAAAPPVAASGISTTIKGSLAANSGWLAFFASWAGMFGGLLGGFAGSWTALSEDRNAEQRKSTLRFLLKIWLAAVLIALVSLELYRVRDWFAWSEQIYVNILAAAYALTWGIIATATVRYQAHCVARDNATTPGKISFPLRVAIAAGPTLAATSWLIAVALSSGDSLGAGVASAAVVAVAAIGVYVFGHRLREFMLIQTVTWCAVIVGLLNWRLDEWFVAGRDLSLFWVDVIALILCAWLWIATRRAWTP